MSSSSSSKSDDEVESANNGEGSIIDPSKKRVDYSDGTYWSPSWSQAKVDAYKRERASVQAERRAGFGRDIFDRNKDDVADQVMPLNDQETHKNDIMIAKMKKKVE